MKTDTRKTPQGSFKGIFTRVAMAAVLAGTVFAATAKPAGAQGFSVQFGVGHPFYGRPAYGPVYAPPVYGPAYGSPYGPAYGPGFYAERRHEEWLRHERWERAFHYRQPAYGFYGR